MEKIYARGDWGLKWNGTFFECDFPLDSIAIGGEWVNRWKTYKHGEITRAKCRLVAFGSLQKEVTACFKTFSATPNAASIRLLLATAVRKRLPLSLHDTAQEFVRLGMLRCT